MNILISFLRIIHLEKRNIHLSCKSFYNCGFTCARRTFKNYSARQASFICNKRCTNFRTPNINYIFLKFFFNFFHTAQFIKALEIPFVILVRLKSSFVAKFTHQAFVVIIKTFFYAFVKIFARKNCFAFSISKYRND